MFNLNFSTILTQKVAPQIIYKGGRILLILLLLMILKKIGNNFIEKGIDSFLAKAPKKFKKKNKLERRKTLERVLTSILNISIIIVGFLTILPELGINITPLLAGAGVVGLAISMGASNLVKDYIAGLFILMEDQYRVGEEVQISGLKGEVKDFNLRRTLLKDEENALHFIPNGQIAKTTNFSRK